MKHMKLVILVHSQKQRDMDAGIHLASSCLHSRGL